MDGHRVGALFIWTLIIAALLLVLFLFQAFGTTRNICGTNPIAIEFFCDYSYHNNRPQKHTAL